MCHLDKYIVLELRTGQTFCVASEDRDDIIRAVKAFNETTDEYGEGKDELLTLRSISGSGVWLLASAIIMVTETSLESRARNEMLNGFVDSDIAEEIVRLRRQEDTVNAVTR